VKTVQEPKKTNTVSWNWAKSVKGEGLVSCKNFFPILLIISMKYVQNKKIELWMREIILCCEMNLFFLIVLFILVFLSKYRSTYLLGCKDPRGFTFHQQRPRPRGLLKSIQLNSGRKKVRNPKTNCENCTRAEKKKHTEKQILCHEIEPNLSKDRATHEGDTPSFWDEFTNSLFSW
jgi:hypothetical protein